jgi:hypothetical protein
MIIEPCQHRGAIFTYAENMLCGWRKQQEPIFRCALFGVCTYRPFRHCQTETVCLRCEHLNSNAEPPIIPTRSDEDPTTDPTTGSGCNCKTA